MRNKHLKKSLIPNNASQRNKTKYIDQDAAFHLDLNKTGNDLKVFISIKHLQHDFQCFSEWSKKEMKEFWNFNTKLHELTWKDVYASARKSNKSGVGYTVIPIKNYPDSSFKENLSQDITILELRVNKKIRVHGFRNSSVFFLCWLDKNHKITS
ncbi:hypothetical protein K4L44_10750 [Halosquirtibacter laminarini]|uniref:Uncharacterized protein n=1 Tax=Halosquirtibacter laminarini TaxID=3374600 RepID=A0AC61NLH8_9BACT|nr:hypothetical protein K4L44_10750 [Prolixibacteraceae bacterium]